MAEEKNIYQRLMQARIDFAKKNVKPSGYNGHADFEYYELKDIIPVANKVFADNDLMFTVTFSEGLCCGLVYDLLKKDEPIVFTLPHEKIAEPAKFRMNEVQALGSEVTYLRRYVYMLALDIVDADTIDVADKEDAPVVKPAVKASPAKPKAEAPKPKTETAKAKVAKKEEPKEEPKAKVVISSAPKTPADRQAIKKELTNSSDNADVLQINKLKELVSEWVKADPESESLANNLMVQTNGFSVCTKKEAEFLINKITENIKKAKEA